MESLKFKLEAEGKKVYVVPYGGSNLLGAYGFVDAVKELKEQLTEMNLKMDYIFFASSSGGTQAGLRLGIDLFEVDTKLMPISIDKIGYEYKTLAEAVLELLKEGQKSLRIKKTYSIDDARLIHGYDSKGYGVVTSNEKSAIKELAENEGILLDPVYSGRAFYGMLDHIKSQKIEKGGANILFWHTGGLPANFYYSEELMP
ncbi:pyridoxal-phosphate dependent enzyme [Algibacter lectus]|uniref:pyridoxal-phosphate dependent enzyme n=1 Tax=Algibacter lectus TaxID=221126 RepID=UPI0034E4FBE6